MQSPLSNEMREKVLHEMGKLIKQGNEQFSQSGKKPLSKPFHLLYGDCLIRAYRKQYKLFVNGQSKINVIRET